MHFPGLEGKNALLIGGQSNIGQHVTRLFAESGANVVIAALDPVRAEEVAEEVRSTSKGHVVVVETDATDWSSLENAVKTTQDLGSLDFVYEGIAWDQLGHFLDLDPAVWDKIYEVNFRSIMMMYKTVLPIMIKQKSGSIVTMSSVMGRHPSPIEPVYGAMKAAIIHLAQTLAHDVAEHGVRINVVAPGTHVPASVNEIDAQSNWHAFMNNKESLRGAMDEVIANTPLRRLGDPANAALAVLYLASPVTGGFQTGQVLGVDGGQWMPK